MIIVKKISDDDYDDTSYEIIKIVEKILRGEMNISDLENRLKKIHVILMHNEEEEETLLNHIIFNYKNGSEFHKNSGINTLNEKLLEIVKEFLKANIDYLKPNRNGMNSLMLAAQEGLDKIVKEILKVKGDILYDLDNDKNSVFHYSVNYGDFPEVINVLRSSGKGLRKILLKNNQGVTPRKRASNHGFVNAELLLK